MKRLFCLLTSLLIGIAGYGVLLNTAVAEVVTSAKSEEKQGLKMEMVEPFTGIEMVLVKGGCFTMGDVFGDGEEDERPVHQVCLSDYYIGRFEVTQAQWVKVMGKNPSSNRDCGPECPVDSVSWNDVQQFIERLNKQSGKKFRLPTEAEWEYAARSGGKDQKWAGTNDKERLGEFAWYSDNAGTVMHPVGKKKPNGLGIYDMSGNATEWCLDWYDRDYYKNSPKDNPSGPPAGQRRVIRGGYYEDAGSVRTTKRFNDSPDTVDGTYGFRLVLPVE